MILTSVELDHVDIFPSFDAVKDVFKKLVHAIPSDGLLVVCADSPEAVAVAKLAGCKVEQYSVNGVRRRAAVAQQDDGHCAATTPVVSSAMSASASTTR